MSFEEYYKVYLTYHTKPLTRELHLLGNVATLIYILWASFNAPWALLFSPFIVYLFAWPSHWWVEKNKPAAFKNPIKAKMADWKMTYQMIVGDL